VVGCDLSEETLSIAEAKGELGDVSIEYRQCPAEALRVDDDSFDVAVVGAEVQALDADGQHSLRGAVKKVAAPLVAGGAIHGLTTSDTATATA
jgi:ubiquinone/menaquinone biosynthesis C-methylase UbiE